MTNGRMWVERAPAAERVLALEVLRPAERPIPTALVQDRPAVGEPQLRRGITRVTDELAILVVRDEPVREQARLEPLAMPRPLVVERKTLRIGAQLGESCRLEAELEWHAATRAGR